MGSNKNGYCNSCSASIRQDGSDLTLTVKTEAKSNEITALPLLIDMLELQGATVTIALMCPDTAPYDAWSGLQSVSMVESMRQTNDSVTAEKRYFVSSLPPDAERLAQAIRSHWAIENQLHWCLDVTFGEDACRNRTGHAPENLNIVRKIAMNLLRLDPLKKTLPKKRVRASVNP